MPKGSGAGGLGPGKRCPACGEIKARTPDHWHFYPPHRGGTPRIDSCCIPCRRAIGRRAMAKKNAPFNGAAALSAYRASNISTRVLFDVLAEERGPAEAQQIVNQERAAHGLPPMRLGWDR